MSGWRGIECTGERYVPWVDPATPEIHYEHLHRYLFASRLATGKEILDLGCGEGYGCSILAETAVRVVGVDVDMQTIQHASRNYSRPNLEFLVGSATAVPIGGQNIFDVVTCFEVIEHIEEQEGLLKEVSRLVKRDGIFLVSTPNKLLYTDVPKYHNPFHKRELYLSDFANLLKKYFAVVEFLGQRVLSGSHIWHLGSSEGRCVEFAVMKDSGGFARIDVGGVVPMYFLAIASSSVIPRDLPFFSNLADTSDELYTRLRRAIEDRDRQLARVYRSKSWRMTGPLRRIWYAAHVIGKSLTVAARRRNP